MIAFSKISKEEPYLLFKTLYNKALNKKQSSIEAASVSSFNTNTNEVESRFVNIKYLIEKKFIFFSNYNSLKANNFDNHDQISLLFYWNKIDVQIRIKANICRSNEEFSNKHYDERSSKKNALAHSSKQSTKVTSYDSVIKDYKEILKSESLISLRPKYWGGFDIFPYYFEFWEGNPHRVNKRTVFKFANKGWKKYFLSP